MRWSNLVRSRTLVEVAVEKLQPWRARLVKSRHQKAAAHAEREGVFSIQHWAWGRIGLPVRVVTVAEAETMNSFLSVYGQQSCLEVGWIVGLLALAGAGRLGADIARIDRQRQHQF
jgi:hypothetical protein